MSEITGKEIGKQLKLNRITVEDALHDLASIGYCPNVLNDDSGRWAVAFDGYQTVVMGRRAEDVDASFHVPKANWKKTIREALLYHLKK